MNTPLTFADADVLSSSTYSFSIRHSQEMPAYYELAIEGGQGDFAHWVISMPLKQLAKRPVLLWLLEAPGLGSLSCVETGCLQLASTQLGTSPTLQTELAQGVLRLNFNGQLLRGYYRLHCLPTGSGQLWQLTPISRV